MTSILPHLKQEDSPIACPLSIAKTWISEWLNQNQLYFLDHSHLRGIDASPVLALHEMSDSFPLAWDRRYVSRTEKGFSRFIPTCVG